MQADRALLTVPAVRRAAVLGSPVAHSLSPVLHTAAYAALGLTAWRYTREECGEDELAPLVDRLGPEWAGLSLTMPLKRVALEVADEVSAEAAAIGAANTLLLGAVRRAENTDAGGVADALAAAGVAPARRPVLLGAGGTAQAAVAGLRDAGHTRGAGVTVVVREPSRTRALRATADRLGVTMDVVRLDAAGVVLPEADLVISTLPAGATDVLSGVGWAPGGTLFDVVYHPWPTPLAASASAAGCRVIGGLDLLLHQAARQVTLMTGCPAPLDAMRAALAAVR